MAITCLYFAQSFYDFRTGELNGGRYGTPKVVFFVVLCISAILDIPLFVGCIVQGGPTDCEWNSPSYIVFWLFHLVATCGYIYAIITPPILWSDIIQQRDGNLWNSAYPADSTKIFFRVVYVLFCLNEFITLVGSTMYQNPDNQAAYTKSNSLGAITDCFTPVITTVVTVGCLWSGIVLQRHVVSVGLRGSTQFRIFVRLNITMFIIIVTYIMRSLLVLTLFEDMPHEYVRFFHPMRKNFFLWLLWTRWLPCIFCSFCLMNEMRFKGVGNGDSRHSGDALQQGLLGATGRQSSSMNVNPRSSILSGILGWGSNRGSTTARAVSADSGRSNDSALEETYSMLSSVDFPDSASDSSLQHRTSPFDSPPRADRKRRDRERGRRAGAVSGAVYGDHLGGTPSAESHRSRKHMTTAGPLGIRSESTDTAEYKFDYGYGGGTPPRTSIDHFFTFAAPGLNLSNIANTDSHFDGINNNYSSSIPIEAPVGGRSALSAFGSMPGGVRPVTSFSPPTGAVSAYTADFINADERASPEINSRSL